MSDNLRRYRAICHASHKPIHAPTGHCARHVQTLAALMSGIVGVGRDAAAPHRHKASPIGSKGRESRGQTLCQMARHDRYLGGECTLSRYGGDLIRSIEALETGVLVMDGSVRRARLLRR